MKFKNLVLSAAGGVLAVAAIGHFAAPKLTAAIKAAFVEVVIPSKPFFDRVILGRGVFLSIGPDTGTLGVSNILLTNFAPDTQQVRISQPVLSNGNCSTGVYMGDSYPNVTVWVPGNSTLTLVYPSPLVFQGTAGHTCIGGYSITGAYVEMEVTGFVN